MAVHVNEILTKGNAAHVMRALWQSEVPLLEAELIELPCFTGSVVPEEALRCALYDLKDAHEIRKREDGTWELRDHCEECGDHHASYRSEWDRVLCGSCHDESCDMAEGDRAFDLKNDR